LSDLRSLVDEPGIQLIQGVQEGACVAMADGYARVSGKRASSSLRISDAQRAHAARQQLEDQIPVVVAAASGGQDALGGDAMQEYDHIESMTQPITKWHWVAQTTDAIAATTRRALKFASTQPPARLCVLAGESSADTRVRVDLRRYAV